MQLKVSTDYAIRIVLHLAVKGGAATSSEISGQMGVPQSVIATLAKPLQKAGILTTQRGGVFREYLTDAAQSVGVSYRQAQRIMQSLCALGVLQKVDSGFQILDMPQLQALSCQGEATA